jgi:hypothetical protein
MAEKGIFWGLFVRKVVESDVLELSSLSTNSMIRFPLAIDGLPAGRATVKPVLTFPAESGTQYTAPYTSVSQPPGRGPVPGRGINYTGPREFVILVF